VLVAKHVIRMPSASVLVNWVPGWGRWLSSGVDQRLAPSPALLRQLGQSQSGGGDVVGSGVGARVPRPEEGGDWLKTGSARSVVDEGRQRVMAIGLLSGRGRVLFVGVRNHQDAVEDDRDLAVAVQPVHAGQSRDCGLRGDRNG
jgi:hypothetical protein